MGATDIENNKSMNYWEDSNRFQLPHMALDTLFQ